MLDCVFNGAEGLSVSVECTDLYCFFLMLSVRKSNYDVYIKTNLEYGRRRLDGDVLGDCGLIERLSENRWIVVNV